jgi:hypothetical protein
MSRIPVPTHSPSHTRAHQEPVPFPAERAVSPLPPSRHNSAHSAPMSSLSGPASSVSGKKVSKRALGDEVCIAVLFLSEIWFRHLDNRHAVISSAVYKFLLFFAHTFLNTLGANLFF